MRENSNILKIQSQDNVAVALEGLKKGDVCVLDNESIQVLENIPFGHKIALKDFAENERVIKYGYPIGNTSKVIRKGEHIHTHNLSTALSEKEDYTYSAKEISKSDEISEKLYFRGYLRESGKVGIRNEIWVIPTVGCVNKTAEYLAQKANEDYAGMTDGFFAFQHNMGCSQLGEDLLRTQKILKGLVTHPNAAGVLVVSLGCENNNLEEFCKTLGDISSYRIEFLQVQESWDEYEEGMEKLGKLAKLAAGDKREKIGLEKLIIGLKCGGSDGFSGITANPLCGRITDFVTSQGGAALLTEVPEMFGAEHILMRRAVSETVFCQITKLINGYKEYFQRYGQVVYENPSPGNKKGGITTLEEKSLGCVQKGGTSPVEGTLEYGENPQRGGLYLINGPGNDQVSCTNLTASGAQMILFTTGRGTPFGAPVPTVKISSNSELSRKKGRWIDYDAGQMLCREPDRVTGDFLQYLIQVASGEVKTKNEIRGFREISIFRDGVIM